MGVLPPHCKNAIFGLFHLPYRIAKRGSPPFHLPGDAGALVLAGGTITPLYHSNDSAIEIVHAIAAPIRSAKGDAVRTSRFFALASDSSTHRAAHKQELIYTRTWCDAGITTSYLTLHKLQDGTVVGILAAYKQAVLHAGLPVDQWVTRLFWYCADGVEVMQSTGNGVAKLLMKLQANVLGYSVVIPVRTKCHGADLAFRDAMDSSHKFVDLVADMMGSVEAWFKNAPTCLCNLRRLAATIIPICCIALWGPRFAFVGLQIFLLPSTK